LVITLLTVVHNQFKGSGSELGRIDPTSFLSVYLLLYPVLQWGVGGWLLAPEEKKEVKNPIESIGMNTNAKLSFASFDHFDQNGSFNSEEDTLQTASTSSSTSPTTYQQQDDDPLMMEGGGPSSISLSSLRNVSPPTINEHTPLMTSTLSQELQELDVMPLTTTLLRISRKVCQPPVIASIAGLFIASFPNVRGLLVNIWGSNGETAPFDWMFDGIYSVGQAAVPINMVSCLVLWKQCFRGYMTNFCSALLYIHRRYWVLIYHLRSRKSRKKKTRRKKPNFFRTGQCLQLS